MARRKRRTQRSVHRAFLYRHRDLYPALLEFQEGGCAVCGQPPGARKLDMDHDHKKMELRGLLCTTCNRRLTGRITIPWLRKAADYLENTPFAEYRRIHSDVAEGETP